MSEGPEGLCYGKGKCKRAQRVATLLSALVSASTNQGKWHGHLRDIWYTSSSLPTAQPTANTGPQHRQSHCVFTAGL